eukprot:2403428-Rhodomonas_salina.1
MATPAVVAPVGLSSWDTRRISWTSHKKEAVEMFSKKHQDYINTGTQALFKLIQNEQEKVKQAGALVNTVKTNLNLWTMPAEIKILKDLTDTREAGR